MAVFPIATQNRSLELALGGIAASEPTGTTDTLDLGTGSTSYAIDLQSATGDVTLTLSNPTEGFTYTLKIIQGPTARDIVWPAEVTWLAGAPPVLSPSDDDVDLIELFFDGTTFFGRPLEGSGGSGGSVDSVNGQTGAVTLTAGDVGADPAGTADLAVENAQATATPSQVAEASLTGQSGLFALEDHIHQDRLNDAEIILLSRVMS